MTKHRTEPRISVNKLAQYITSRATRQNQILRNAKFPPDYITTYYREAAEAISLFIASEMTDFAILDRAIANLNQKPADHIQETRRIAGNIDAIEKFGGMLDEIDFNGAMPKLGAQTAPHLKISNVSVSVRPEITLHSKRKGSSAVGGIKLHFPVTEPLDAEQAGYVSAMMYSFCDHHLHQTGAPLPQNCIVLDIASQTAYPGVKAVTRRLNDIKSACTQIASLWPSITQ